MAIREIRLLGDPVLRERAQPIAAIDEEVRKLARDLQDTLAKADGVGLAGSRAWIAGTVDAERGLSLGEQVDDGVQMPLALGHPEDA